MTTQPVREGATDGVGVILLEEVQPLANEGRFDVVDQAGIKGDGLGLLGKLLTVSVARGELPEGTDVHGKAMALRTLSIGINALSKAVRSEAEL